MVLCGSANLVGVRSGQKNDKKWCSVVLDALDNPLERVEYFVPDELIGKVETSHWSRFCFCSCVSGKGTFFWFQACRY